MMPRRAICNLPLRESELTANPRTWVLPERLPILFWQHKPWADSLR